MAARHTGRRRVLLAGNASPDKRSHIRTYGRAGIVFEDIPFDAATGLVDRAALQAALGPDVAAFYLDLPSYFGGIDTKTFIIAGVVGVLLALVLARWVERALSRSLVSPVLTAFCT